MATPPIVTSQTQVNPQFWLNAANAAVRRECGWHVAPVITETLILDGRGGPTLLLPSQRVTAVLSVKNDGEDVTGQVRFSRRAGVLTLASGWSTEVGSIEIELTHGHPIEDVPEIAALIVTLTKRAAVGGTVVSQSVGPFAQRVGTTRDGTPAALPLLDLERELLAPYRITWGAG